MELYSTGLVSHLAKRLGSGEQSIRLILSLLAGYPLAFAYRNFFHGKQEAVQHIYFVVTGLSLCYFNFGGDSIHSALNIVAVWALLSVLGGTSLSVGLAFIFNTLYLFAAYYNVTGDSYDISWATPHCVLTLRLTGVVFDVYDGAKRQEKLSKEQKETALSNRPSLLAMAGHVYFFGGFLVGPQFSMKKYQAFVSGEFTKDLGSGPPRNVALALMRLWLGVLYIAAFQVLCGFVFTEEYMLSPEFHNLNFFLKCAYITVWGKLTISKYVGCWLIAEGSCILTGLTYNGHDINGNSLWNGCTNVHVWDFEMVHTLRGLIASFNVNTNKWMSQYVFKRLRFLGSVQVSQAVTLAYLSIWHGLHSGYYMNFFLEFIMVNGETQLADLTRRLPSLKSLYNNSTIWPFLWLAKKIMVHFCLGYALISFVQLKFHRYSQLSDLRDFFQSRAYGRQSFGMSGLGYALVSFVQLKFHRYSQVYSSVYYVGHVIFLVFPLVYYLLKSILPVPAKDTVSNGVHHNNSSEQTSKKAKKIS